MKIRVDSTLILHSNFRGHFRINSPSHFRTTFRFECADFDGTSIMINSADFRDLIIGTGTEKEKKRINQLIDLNNLRPHIILLGYREDATDIINISDLIF